MIRLTILRDFEARWRLALESARESAGAPQPTVGSGGADSLAIEVRLPSAGSSHTAEVQLWFAALRRLVAEWLKEAEARGSRRRPVLLHAEPHSAASGGLSVRVYPGSPWRIECVGAIAYLVERFAATLDGFRSQPAFPVGARRFTLDGPEAPRDSAFLLAQAAAWWATAGPPDAYSLMEAIRQRISDQVTRVAEGHPWRNHLYREALYAHLFELELEGMWSMAWIFGERSIGEVEVEGWTREFEAALRASRPELFFGFNGLGRPTAPNERSREEKAEAIRPLPTIDLGGFDEPENAERTRPEAMQRLCLRWGLSWSDAAKVLKVIASQRTLLPDRKGSTERSVLYFAYGSCMCRPSFRETVPRYELIGAARLEGHRLAFTYKSIARGGGVADVVPDPAHSVWGVLFRVPQEYLARLDEREGAHLGLYERTWLAVEFEGSVLEPVLTYTVVNKEPHDLSPTPEYAGLIFDGARGLVPPHYSAWLLEKFSEFDIEPELPD